MTIAVAIGWTVVGIAAGVWLYLLALAVRHCLRGLDSGRPWWD